VPYTPPPWAAALPSPPPHRLALARLPPPIHPWHVPGLPGVSLYIKRDDLTGMELSGNKVRKLEFILADAPRPTWQPTPL
jgi:1-aminocyclopropane-1-carboxylate deaminase/D-cysteine desulfhydrase-like pyridoxal-dependent ACC family enzyme